MHPLVKISGDPYKAGGDYGKQAGDRIRQSITSYKAIFNRHGTVDWTTAKKTALRYRSVIKTANPSALDEIRGIADGAGLAFEDVLALNLRSEFSFVQPPGCTSVAVTGDATSDGHTYIGQNFDWKPSLRDSCIVLHVSRDDRPTIMMFLEAGLIANLGLNSHGIGLCHNALVTEKRSIGVPTIVLRRTLLHSVSFGEAIATILRARRTCAVNYMIAHEHGEVIDLEAAVGDLGCLYPENGILTHSNHIVSGIRVNDLGPNAFPDTLFRFKRAHNLLARKRGSIGVADLKEVLSDHFNYPSSICRHMPENVEDEYERAEYMESLASVIMDLTAKKMYVSSGPPCESPYEELSV